MVGGLLEDKLTLSQTVSFTVDVGVGVWSQLLPAVCPRLTQRLDGQKEGFVGESPGGLQPGATYAPCAPHDLRHVSRSLSWLHIYKMEVTALLFSLSLCCLSSLEIKMVSYCV